MRLLLFTMIVSSLSFALPARVGENFRTKIEGEYIVKTTNKALTANAKALGAGFYLVKANEKALKGTKYFPNYEYHGNYLESAPNDPRATEQFHHTMIKTNLAWNTTQGDSELIVAVTDNEFEMDHDDMKGQWWTNSDEIAGNGIDDDGNGYIDDVNGWDFIEQGPNPDHDGGPTHGTHVAGIIAAKANNGIGVAGIAPNVKIMPLRWYGTERPWTSAIILETYTYAVDNGAKIINTSYNIDGLVDDAAYLEAIDYIVQNDVLLFNSAGNSAKKNPPRQKIEEIVLVCSVKSKDERGADKKSSFSNYGDGIDVCAPGDPILAPVQGRSSTTGESRYGELQGTSMAAPVAAAVAALIWSHNPNFTALDVRETLERTADNIDDVNSRRFRGFLGKGRVNAEMALK
jgi:subtilisin family serine protease